MTEMPTTPPQVPSAGPAPPPTGKGLAVTSLILGICAVIPCLGALAGLVGLILGIIALATARPGKGLAVAGIVLSVVLGFLGSTVGTAIIIPTLSRARGLAAQATCAANLNAVGLAVRLYMSDNRDQVPPNMQALIDEDMIDDMAFKCPGANRDGRNDFFVHWAATAASPGMALFACDLKGNHRDGRNVLHFNGAVIFMTEANFQAALAAPENAAFAEALRQLERP